MYHFQTFDATKNAKNENQIILRLQLSFITRFMQNED